MAGVRSKVRRSRLILKVPFLKQGGEGLGFLSPVDLGLQPGTRTALGRFLRHTNRFGSNGSAQMKLTLTLAKAPTVVNGDKTAIFLTLCDNLLWFFEQTLP